MTQHRHHRLGIRTHAAPQQESFGGLLDQHAQAIGNRQGALSAGERHEWGFLAIHHVVSQRAVGKHAGRQRRQLIVQTTGGGIDNHVEATTLQGFIPPRLDQTVSGELRLQFAGLGSSAINDEHAGRPHFQHGQQHPARRAARPHQEDGLAFQREAEVVHNIPHQAGAVGVIAINFAAFRELQGVDRLRQTRPFAEAGSQLPGLHLERHRHVQAFPARAAEFGNALGEAVKRREKRFIAQVLAGLAGKRGVDQRRLAMGNGVADDGITISHRWRSDAVEWPGFYQVGAPLSDHPHLQQENLPTDAERYEVGKKVTLVSVAVNLSLSVLQIVVGYFGKSQALLADGMHTLSDLASDFLVLWANRHGSVAADEQHPYGHRRIETAATLALGAALLGIGATMMWSGVQRLQTQQTFQTVHIATLLIAIVTLISKESLYHYLIGAAKKLNSHMLAANAWHTRADAATSLVGTIGIAGNLLGYTYMDALAAVAVSFMIARMGWKLGYEALAELIDTGLDEEQVSAIRQTLLETPGVRGLHELRTRRMGERALVDAHVLVDPRISVSEGHFIAEFARGRVLNRHNAQDVLVHIDPEDDSTMALNINLPPRKVLLEHLSNCLGESLNHAPQIILHYLEGRAEADIFFPPEFCANSDGLQKIRAKVAEMLKDDPYYSAVRLHSSYAP